MSELKLKDHFKLEENLREINHIDFKIDQVTIKKIVDKYISKFSNAINDDKIQFFFSIIKYNKRLEAERKYSIEKIHKFSEDLLITDKQKYISYVIREKKDDWENIQYFLNSGSELYDQFTSISSKYTNFVEAQMEHFDFSSSFLKNELKSIKEHELFIKEDFYHLVKYTFKNEYAFFISQEGKNKLIEYFKIFEIDAFYSSLNLAVGEYIKNKIEVQNIKLEEVIGSNNEIAVFTNFLIKELHYVRHNRFQHLNQLLEAYRVLEQNLKALFTRGEQKQNRHDYWKKAITLSDKYIVNNVTESVNEIAFYYNNRVFVEVSEDNHSTNVYYKSHFEEEIRKQKSWHNVYKRTDERCLQLNHRRGWEKKYDNKIKGFIR